MLSRTVALGSRAPLSWQLDAGRHDWSSARYGSALAYDSVRQKVVLFGGGSPTDDRLGDTWEWDGTTRSQVASGGPSPRFYAGMAYDAARQVSVLFGGTDAPFSDLADTWTWDGTAWQQYPGTGAQPA